MAHRPEEAWGGIELRHPRELHHSRGHGSPAEPALHGRLAQDAALCELEGVAVGQVFLYVVFYLLYFAASVTTLLSLLARTALLKPPNSPTTQRTVPIPTIL
jgi:hypothetical protein